MVTCKRCNEDGVFVDHGPTVGQGWFCRTCKDDIDHHENRFGNLATEQKNQKRKNPPGFFFETDFINLAPGTIRIRKGCPLDAMDAAIKALADFNAVPLDEDKLWD